MKPGYVYLLINKPNGVLYIGVTDDLSKRIAQHRSREVAGFSKRYNCARLVCFEGFDDIHDARQFEVRMKKWNRGWKLRRIAGQNPDWRDLTDTLPV
ncbi:GIY-YIG nuclease family protein [Novosphingobium lentum]|uniref:GIY-YIG nuclease family protein n=1 Tax=Novosphingobium lentum TaxID=145287 RepID=UPI00082F2087|nr:GIY-YIG nuclease family protein [Novosphingobium lentum]